MTIDTDILKAIGSIIGAIVIVGAAAWNVIKPVSRWLQSRPFLRVLKQSDPATHAQIKPLQGQVAPDVLTVLADQAAQLKQQGVQTAWILEQLSATEKQRDSATRDRDTASAARDECEKRQDELEAQNSRLQTALAELQLMILDLKDKIESQAQQIEQLQIAKNVRG